MLFATMAWERTSESEKQNLSGQSVLWCSYGGRLVGSVAVCLCLEEDQCSSDVAAVLSSVLKCQRHIANSHPSLVR